MLEYKWYIGIPYVTLFDLLTFIWWLYNFWLFFKEKWQIGTLHFQLTNLNDPPAPYFILRKFSLLLLQVCNHP